MSSEAEEGLVSPDQLDEIRQNVLGKWGELQVNVYCIPDIATATGRLSTFQARHSINSGK